MVKAEMTVHVKDLPEVKKYVQQLEDACLVLWAELPAEQVRVLREETPALADFLVHLHHAIEHEQAMVRVNTWGTDE